MSTLSRFLNVSNSCVCAKRRIDAERTSSKWNVRKFKTARQIFFFVKDRFRERESFCFAYFASSFFVLSHFHGFRFSWEKKMKKKIWHFFLWQDFFLNFFKRDQQPGTREFNSFLFCLPKFDLKGDFVKFWLRFCIFVWVRQASLLLGVFCLKLWNIRTTFLMVPESAKINICQK